MGDKIVAIKNYIWFICRIVCLVAVAFGIIYAIFQPYNGERFSISFEIGDKKDESVITGEDEEIIGATAPSNESSGIARGELYTLPAVNPPASEEYLNDSSVKFLVDSTFIGLRSKNLLNTNQVWGTVSGSLPIGTVSEAVIKFPNDGSEISPADAAMITKPRVLYIGIGSDGLASTDKDTFIAQYDKLINDIRSSSPDTTIVCFSLCSVPPDYSGPDGLSITVMSDGNDWVQMVCRDCGVYFLDVSDPLSDGSGGLRTSYTEANGKTLNSAGLGIVLQTVREHAVQ